MLLCVVRFRRIATSGVLGICRQKLASGNGLVQPRRSLVQAVDAAGIGCLAGYGLLAWLARLPGEPALAAFLAIVAWTALLTFALYACHGNGKPLPAARLIFWAVAFRICGLLGGPFYEDDFHRYLWDAYRFVEDGTPFGTVPEDFFLDASVPETFQRVLDQINNPHLATIYAPITQLAFLLGYAFAPGSVAALQAIFILCDLLLIALLLRLAPARGVLLYAWCPLVVKEIAFTAHPESLGVCLLLAAIVLARGRRLCAAATCLALAVGAKIFALLLVPFVLMRGRAVHWAVFVGVLALIYAPFALLGGSGMETTRVFAMEWRFNAALFALLALPLSEFHARLAAGLTLLGFWLWCCWWQWRAVDVDAVPRGDWIYGAMLFLAPVVNPWYCIWLLPFAAIYPSAWAWTASVALLLSYATGLNLPDWQLHPYGHPSWVRLVEFGAVALAFGWDLLRRREERCTAI